MFIKETPVQCEIKARHILKTQSFFLIKYLDSLIRGPEDKISNNQPQLIYTSSVICIMKLRLKNAYKS
jgi:hypothetical protein